MAAKTKSGGGYAARAQQADDLAASLAKRAAEQRAQDDAMARGDEPLPLPADTETDARPQEKTAPIRERGSRYGLQPGLQRFTITTETELINKLKDYAYTERLSLREAVTQMFHAFLDDKTDLIRDPKRK